MERRVLLAIFLSFLVLYVYQALVVKPVPKRPGATPPTAEAGPGTAAGSQPVAPPSAPKNVAAAAPEQPAVTPASTPVVSEAAERDVRVETRDVIAVFTNRGGRIKSWRLKQYKDKQGDPQELIANKLPGQPLPFTLRLADDEQTSSTLNNAVYAVSGAPADGVISSPTDLRFEYRDEAGLHVTKTFHLEPAAYIATFDTAVTSGERRLSPAIVWGPAIGDIGEVSRYTQRPEGLLLQNDKTQRLTSKEFAKQSTYEGDFKFAGVDDNYFLTVAIFTGPTKITYQPVSIPPVADSKEQPREFVSFAVEPQKLPARFFIGPKDFDVLASIDQEFTGAINFGMFRVIVVPLLRSLKWVNGFIGNYGWAIVILTVMINALMFPLRHKSAVSMRKMQEIQPQVKSIQDRYAKLKATDPAKQNMNKELMQLYRERGVNPAGGCVPMLLTFPVLFAMWALLQTSIELRGAPWFGWIHDLSSHDPYFVLAALMGATGFWQQRMMPQTGADPAQQKMMMFMPLMMTVMLAWLPAGALIYYVVTNLWMIGQQYLTNYLIGPPNVRAVRPPAERRMKRAGSGKTEAAARETS